MELVALFIRLPQVAEPETELVIVLHKHWQVNYERRRRLIGTSAHILAPDLLADLHLQAASRSNL